MPAKEKILNLKVSNLMSPFTTEIILEIPVFSLAFGR